MKLKSISIDGVGGIKHIDLEFNDNMNLICGTNGIGKTTILECISHLFIEKGTEKLKRNVNYIEGKIKANIEIDQNLVEWSFVVKDFEPEDKDYFSTKNREKSKEILSFSQFRDIKYVKLNEIKRDPERKDYINTDLAYNGISANDIKSWLVQRILWSKHEGILCKEQLENLKLSKEIFSILDKNVTFSRIIPDTFDIMVNTRQGEIYLEYLSSGYKSCVYILLGIIKEIEYRYKNPHIMIKDFEGIILIDEIDVHLHPQWQAYLVKALKDILPKAQIIATTHSPTIIQTAENNEIIALYYDENDNICIRENEKNQYGYKGWSIEEILKDVMGLEDIKSEFYKEQLKIFDKAIDEENYELAKLTYSIIDKMLHPENYLRKILKIQMAGLGDYSDKDN